MTKPMTATAFVKKHNNVICAYLETTTNWETPRSRNPKTRLAYPTARMMLDEILTQRLRGDWTIRNRVRKGRRFQFHIQLVSDLDLATLKNLFSMESISCEEARYRMCFAGFYKSVDYMRIGVALGILDPPPKTGRL
jgi:hypothetical protein